MTQLEAADLPGIDQPRVSNLPHRIQGWIYPGNSRGPG